MPLGTEVDLGPGDIVLDGNPARPKGWRHSTPQVWPTCCGQTAAWIKVPIGTWVGVGLGDIVLHGDSALPPTPEGAQPSIFGPCLLWPNG